jgi:DNA-binding NarL/FixJ family response regulator
LDPLYEFQDRHGSASSLSFAASMKKNTKDKDNPLDRLSAREREVLLLVVDGRTSKEIAVQLGVSPGSVDTYRSRVMAKLEVDDLPTLVRVAIRHGLVKP